MTALVAWLWQGTGPGARRARRAARIRRLDAATRHALWWGVLAVVLALPWLPSLVASAGSAAAVAAAAPLPAQDAVVLLPAPPDWLLAHRARRMARYGRRSAASAGAQPAFVVASQARGARTRARAAAAGCSLWSSRAASRAPVTLLVSAPRPDRVRGRPRPRRRRAPAHPAAALDDEALDQIVMHEHAHLQRCDDVWRLLQALVECVAGLHPAVRIAARPDRSGARSGVRRSRRAPRRAMPSATPRASPTRPPAAASARGSHYAPAAPRPWPALGARRARDPPARRDPPPPFAPDAGRDARRRLVLLGTVAGASAHLDPLVAFRASDARRPLLAATHVGAPPARPPPSPRRRRRRRAARGGSPAAGSPAPASPPRPKPRRPCISPARRALPTQAQTEHAGPPLWPRGTLDTATARLRPPNREFESARRAGRGPRRRGRLPRMAARPSAARRAAAEPAVGAGAKKAGTSVGGFFVRAGRAVGKSF